MIVYGMFDNEDRSMWQSDEDEDPPTEVSFEYETDTVDKCAALLEANPELEYIAFSAGFDVDEGYQGKAKGGNVHVYRYAMYLTFHNDWSGCQFEFQIDQTSVAPKNDNVIGDAT